MRTHTGFRILAGVLLLILIVAPSVMATGAVVTGATGGGVNASVFITNNETGVPDSRISPYTETPEPVTLFKIELDEEQLPGPRYMAFGPSVIQFSVNPLFLLAVIIIIAVVLVAWFRVKRWNGRNDGDNRKN